MSINQCNIYFSFYIILFISILFEFSFSFFQTVFLFILTFRYFFQIPSIEFVCIFFLFSAVPHHHHTSHPHRNSLLLMLPSFLFFFTVKHFSPPLPSSFTLLFLYPHVFFSPRPLFKRFLLLSRHTPRNTLRNTLKIIDKTSSGFRITFKQWLIS